MLLFFFCIHPSLYLTTNRIKTFYSLIAIQIFESSEYNRIWFKLEFLEKYNFVFIAIRFYSFANNKNDIHLFINCSLEFIFECKWNVNQLTINIRRTSTKQNLAAS